MSGAQERCLCLSRRRFLHHSAVAGLGLALGARRATAALTALRMSCWSQPISEQTNVFAAQEFGWFREAGLEFTFVPGAGGGEAVKHVLAGNADVAFANIEPLLFAVEKGEKLKAVYNIYPQNVFNVVSLKSKNVGQPQDLKGKRIGVYSMESGTRHNLRIILRSVGLDETDVEVIPTGVLNFAPLIQGQVDATAATDTGLWAAQQRGLGEVNVIWARDYLNTPTDVFIVTEGFYQTRQDVLRNFLTVYKRGTQWMLEHPDEAAQLAVKHAIDGKDAQRNLEIIKIRNAASVNTETQQHGLGWFNLELLEKVARTFRDLGLLKQALDMRQIFTNELVQAL
jgi:NitT/TauT family transport system substrate-binding protein